MSRTYKFTATMASAVIGSVPSFDGIVAAGLIRRDRLALPEIDDWPIDLELPIERKTILLSRIPDRDVHPSLVRDGFIWVWKSSGPIYSTADVVYGRREFRQRAPHDRYIAHGKKRNVIYGAGKFKPYDLTFPTYYIPQISWYCVTRDPDSIMACLDHITALGKKANRGGGEVLSWSMERAHDEHLWQVEKRMPAPTGEGMLAPIRPPYWHYSRNFPCL